MGSRILLIAQEDPIFLTYRSLTLSSLQRAELERARDTDPRPYLRERAAALLKIADGWSPHGVAVAGLLKPRKPDTVYAWLNRYERFGLAGLLQRPRRHRGFPPLRGTRAGGGRPPAPLPPRD